MVINKFGVFALGISVAAGALLSTGVARAAELRNSPLKPVLADASLLEQIGVEVLAVEPATGVGFARLSSADEEKLSEASHARGSCAGFEELQDMNLQPNNLVLTNVFGELAKQASRNERFRASTDQFAGLQPKAVITIAVGEVNVANIKQTVAYLSGFEDRYNKSANANDSIEGFKKQIEAVLQGSTLPYTVDLISHDSTSQKSIRVHFEGAKRPNEIVVLGGHIDSINQSWFDHAAPGADDNASGSADLLEAMRIFSREAQPERSVEFFWYAGEESGLLGSAEIARDYKSQSKDVVGVVQLDMTSFPGAGEFVIGQMTDFTSAWMRNYFEGLNALYIHAKVIEDKCGYGCSDHASWYRQGYPTMMPFESSFGKMNHKIHSSRDVVDADTNFEHAAMFARVVLAVALDLGNSTARATN